MASRTRADGQQLRPDAAGQMPQSQVQPLVSPPALQSRYTSEKMAWDQPGTSPRKPPPLPQTSAVTLLTSPANSTLLLFGSFVLEKQPGFL